MCSTLKRRDQLRHNIDVSLQPNSNPQNDAAFGSEQIA